ncbi:MAG: pyrroline-5-carboxylate reductase [Oscillospiraceae bacterium]|nr:pyrroline-5-carboxylate reductase [Oscillospiraceae bacterium]
MYKAGFIGCGNMGGTLAAVAAKALGEGQVRTADLDPEKLSRLKEQFGTVPGTGEQVAEACRLVFLGVKPQVMRAATVQIREILAERKDHFCVVSMAAGLTISDIAKQLGGCPVIRIMPNTPAGVGAGVISYALGEGVTEEDETLFLQAMEPAGLLVKLEEGKIDMASALSGCGPAYVCMFVEAMVDGAVRCGLPRAQAEQFALQTVLGTAKLALETGQDPARLRGAVCSPAGSTIEGVAVLEQRGFRGAVMDALFAAYKRNVELQKA